MELNIPEIANLITEIKGLKESLAQPNTLTKQWYNDEECWKLKGGGTLNTYRSNRYFQCKGGIPDGKVGGRKVWSKESVAEWLSITDDQLEAYHKKHCTGAKKRGA